MVILTLVNNVDVSSTQNSVYGSKAVEHPSRAKMILESLKYREASTLTHKEKRILRREMARQVVTLFVAKAKGDHEKSGEAWKTILAIIVALGLVALLIPLVCSLSCGGSDFLAILVGILGLAGIIWLLVIALRKIHRTG